MSDNVYHESSALSSIIVKSRLVSIQDPQGQMPADLSEVCGGLSISCAENSGYGVKIQLTALHKKMPTSSKVDKRLLNSEVRMQWIPS